MICSKCGSEMPEGSIFCNKCGVKLQSEDNKITKQPKEESQIIDNKSDNVKITKLKSIVKNKKVLIPILIICCLVIATGTTYLIIKPPSPEKVFKDFKTIESVKSITTDQITDMLNKTYPAGGGFLGLFKERDRQYKGKVLSLMMDDINNQFQQATGRSISDYNAVKIAHVDIKHKSYSNNYVDISVTVENGGKIPVSYIKINLYYKDDNDKIIRSDWTNDDSVIQPGASQVITKMTENDGWKSVQAEIAEIR